MRSFITFCCLLFITTIGITYAIVEESDAPFIYYFSPTERAIIIERADTTDRTTIDLNPIIPDDHNVIHSVQASPTGEWLAWLSGYVLSSSNGSIQRQRGWIVRIRDQPIISLGDDFVVNLAWSPTNDQLAVLYTPEDDYFGDELRRLKIVDPTTNTTVEGDVWLEAFTTSVDWHSEGDFVYFTTQIQSYDAISGATTRFDRRQIATVSTSGEVTFRSIIEEQTGAISPLPAGRLLYRRDDGLRVIETISTGDVFPLPEIERVITAVVVSPTQSHALVYVNTDQPDAIPRRQLWLLDLGDYSLLHLADDAIPLINDVGYANPFFAFHDYVIPQTTWTPDGSRALFSTADGRVHWLDIATLSVDEAFTSFPSPQAIPNDYVLGSFFADDGTGFIMRNSQIYAYNWQTNVLSDAPLISRLTFGASADGDHIAVIGRCNRLFETDPTDGKCILNRDTQGVQQLPASPIIDDYPYYGDQNTATGLGYLNWHSSKDWIIVGENVERGFIRLRYSISDAGGYFYREFPLDVMTPRWLP